MDFTQFNIAPEFVLAAEDWNDYGPNITNAEPIQGGFTHHMPSNLLSEGCCPYRPTTQQQAQPQQPQQQQPAQAGTHPPLVFRPKSHNTAEIHGTNEPEGTQLLMEEYASFFNTEDYVLFDSAEERYSIPLAATTTIDSNSSTNSSSSSNSTTAPTDQVSFAHIGPNNFVQHTPAAAAAPPPQPQKSFPTHDLDIRHEDPGQTRPQHRGAGRPRKAGPNGPTQKELLHQASVARGTAQKRPRRPRQTKAPAPAPAAIAQQVKGRRIEQCAPQRFVAILPAPFKGLKRSNTTRGD